MTLCLGAFVACGSDDEPGSDDSDAGSPAAGSPGVAEAGAPGTGGSTGGSTVDSAGAGGDVTAAAGAGSGGDSEPVVLGTATKIDPGANRYYSLEGPYWDAANGILLFSDVVEKNGADAGVGDPLPAIHQYDPVTEVFMEFAGYPAAALTSTNGMGIDSTGRLVVTERVNGRLVRVEGNALVPLATTWPVEDGEPLNAPNDVVIGPNDDIYFSDTLWGSSHPDDLRDNAAYHVAPNGDVNRLLTWTSVNGIALSPDARTLYVGNDMANEVMTLALGEDGAPEAGAEPQPFLNKDSVPGGRFSVPDGINVDDDGNIYVALNDWNVNAVAVFNPDGEYVGEYAVPVGLGDGKTPEANGPGNGPSNISFGGADRTTLFITTHHSIWQVEVETPGLP